MATKRHPESVEVDRIFLYEENPRHDPIETQDEIIEHLCKDEQVFNLARSISEAGPNPLELLGLVHIPGSGAASTKKTYQVWEGNRRVCAIKLLNDPDKAPPHLRKDFARLATESGHVPIKKLTAVIFDDHDDLKSWMGIIHNGPQAGIGRVDWDATQKARHFGSNRNRVALAILDTAEDLGFISKEDRKGKLTTAQRFLNSIIMREALGIDTTIPEDITCNRPADDFKKQLSRFIDDLKEGKNVSSRFNKARIDAYGRRLASNPEISGERVEPVSLKKATGGNKKKARKKGRPKRPRPPSHLEYNKELEAAVEARGNAKLASLYYSICFISIEHSLLLTIGVWAFVESLTALAGRNDKTAFTDYYSKQHLSTLGFESQKSKTAIREALSRISNNGNVTKHHELSASFDGLQLVNDLETITPLLIKTAESIEPQK